MKGGIGWNLRISGVERYLYDIYQMLLSREIDIKLCQNYTKTYICKLYVRFTWPELPSMAVQYNGHVIQTETCDNNTALPLVGILVTCFHFIFYSTTKHEIIKIKKITIYYVVWTSLTRVGCFNWLAHY